MATIDDLPIEALSPILRYLNLKELIKYRLVSTKFRFTCDQVIRKLSTLIVRDCPNVSRSHWFLSDELFSYEDAISLKMLSNSINQYNLDQNLKRLIIKHPTTNVQKLVNRLTLLEHLEVSMRLYGIVEIKLPNLRAAKLCSKNGVFILVCPKLAYLSCCTNTTGVFYPEAIKYLATPKLDFRIQIFQNLECLIINGRQTRLDFGFRWNANLLSTFKHLNYLAFCKTQDTNLMKPLLLILESKEIQRPDLRVYLEGVEIEHWFQVCKYTGGPRMLKFQIENYRLLDHKLQFVKTVDYSKLMRFFREIPACFFAKFFNIQEVKVSRQEDEQHFVWFLKKLNNLRKLHLSVCDFDQSFYDRLPSITDRRLRVLSSYGGGEINFNFLQQFELLEKFRTNRRSPELVGLALKMLKIEKFKYLGEFKFATDEANVYVRRDVHKLKQNFDLKIYKHRSGWTSSPIFAKKSIDYNQLKAVLLVDLNV